MWLTLTNTSGKQRVNFDLVQAYGGVLNADRHGCWVQFYADDNESGVTLYDETPDQIDAMINAQFDAALDNHAKALARAT